MKKTILISAFVLASSAVYAQEDKISILDANADGRISVEEAASDPALSAVFAKLDINKDGYLTPSELADN
ncbi:hypothetical protein AB6T38_14490 [Aliiglaciecola sp. SL4]|uniref:hypothetical protein n=1 Tax=Aliiglaciecola sp. SL4 TaxID=3239806 RepID=UPI00355B665B